MRVLHVLGSMNRGGVETWLMSLLRHANRQEVQMDFLVHTSQRGVYDSEALGLGSRIFPCPVPQNLPLYAWRFHNIVTRSGPYDVLHSHVHHFSGFVMWLGRQAGIPVRIAHSHTDSSRSPVRPHLSRRAYYGLARRLIAAHCTRGLAVSRDAACDLFGGDWQRDARFRVLTCGIELTAFHRQIDRSAVRREFGFGDGEVVFGHVGRFDPVKNHRFLVRIAAEIGKQEPRARFLLVGEGPSRAEIAARAQQAGIADRIVFAGARDDVPRLLTGAMDAFVFPSLYEGLPLALIEAQAANLPVTISDTIAAEATVAPALIQRLSLNDSPGVWAECALQRIGRREGGLEEVERSPFNIVNSLCKLLEIYRGIP